MKILLFGGNGQVGQEVRMRARDLNMEILAPVASEVDVTDLTRARKIIQTTDPEYIIHAAAYTNVDQAESDRDLAFAVNAEGTRNIASAAQAGKAIMIYLSTDYVFPGNGQEPIAEDVKTDPKNVYGASKLAGEHAVTELLGERSLIVRTSSVHGQYGHNIVHTILKLLDERDQLQFVQDQIMSPTWAGWLAEVLLDLVRLDARGVLHACCKGSVSWYEFACEVLDIAKDSRPEWTKKRITPVAAAQFQRPARRPAYSVLSTEKLVKTLGRECLDWKIGLRLHMKEIGYE